MQYRIDWVDRETLVYRTSALSVLVRVDYEESLFLGGRVIHADSIQQWQDAGSNEVRAVTEDEREAIIVAIQKHYAGEQRPCRVIQ
ncbi:hypothetical protein [Pseudoxanthomonas sp.]|uniref:hypothetical protein n=1 Tax=Pseudoxanthomonas sp. TaxID=1871049 RepID=UPI003F8014E9